MKEYDLVVIGAGPGGYEAAFEAADAGLKTALIEKDALGGTCLNRGCIPMKSLLHSAGLYQSMLNAEKFGIGASGASYDPAGMQKRKNEVTAQLRKGIEASAKRKKVDIIRGTGIVCGEGIVRAAGEEGEILLHAPHIILATGAVPAVIPVPGADLPGVVTSDELLEKDRRTEQLVIIGGGVIGAEFASLYRALGAEVTVIEFQPQLLPNLDREIAQSLKMQFKKAGIRVFTGAGVKEIRPAQEGLLEVFFDNGREMQSVTGDTVLISTGRKPYSEGLFAEGLCPETERGRILVSENYETSIPGVYAIGDVTGGMMLAHVASAAGRNAVRHITGKGIMENLSYVPSCVYTEPEIACVGMTEEQAKAAGFDAESRKTVMSANGKTVIADGDRGYIRVVFEKESGRLLGAQLVCERATDIIDGFTQALCAGLTVKDLAEVVRPHPTFCEAISDTVRM